MTDYGHELQFGTFLTPTADAPDRVIALARLSEQVGLELATFQDHPYQSRFLDSWTLLSVVAAGTTTLRVAPNVANLQLRAPAVLAKSAASLDLLTGGRVELGLGAGAFGEAVAGYGGPTLSGAQALRALREGVAVIRAIWDTSQRSVRLDGEFHRLAGAHPGPAPAHPIGIWVGAYKPGMLALTGELADGWLPSAGYLAPEGLAEANDRIDDAAAGAGRAPGDVRRLYNLSGRFSSKAGFLQGTSEDWAEQLAELAIGEGVSGFILATDEEDDIRRFAGEVAPAVRELVDAERSAPEAATSAPVLASALASASTGSALPESLPVRPTPDDGRRLSAVRLWDEAARPTGPPAPAGRTYLAPEQAAGQHLVDVHDHLRGELAQVRDLVTQVLSGAVAVGAARETINRMTLRQNSWTLGTYCQSYCRVVATHHTIEDRSMFPHLRRADAGLVPVIDRLEEEHHVISDVLERVDAALVAYVTVPDSGTALQGAVDLLTDTLLSHLSYEERELVEPLARLGFY